MTVAPGPVHGGEDNEDFRQAAMRLSAGVNEAATRSLAYRAAKSYDLEPRG